MEPTRVFLDTNIISCATAEKVALHPEIREGKHCSAGKPDRDITIVTQSWTRRPARDANSEEVRLLRDVAKAATNAVVGLCWSHEVQLELLFQPRIVSFFHDAAVRLELVPTAIDYRNPLWPRFQEGAPGAYMSPSPVLKGFTIALGERPDTAAELVRQFLLRLPDNSPILHHEFRMFHSGARAAHEVPLNAASVLFPLLRTLQNGRYLELLQMLEVQQLTADRRANGYVDAFLLWTAELAACTHFLTIDNGIVERHRHDFMTAVLPSKLLAELRRH